MSSELEDQAREYDGSDKNIPADMRESLYAEWSQYRDQEEALGDSASLRDFRVGYVRGAMIERERYAKEKVEEFIEKVSHMQINQSVGYPDAMQFIAREMFGQRKEGGE